MSSYEEFSHSITLEDQISGKFRCFNAIGGGSIEMLKNS